MTTYSDLKIELRAADIAHDPWGTALSWHFLIADTLHFDHGADTVPQHWEYTPTILGRDDNDLRAEWLVGCDTDTLVQFGNLLHRFVRACDHAGKGY